MKIIKRFIDILATCITWPRLALYPSCRHGRPPEGETGAGATGAGEGRKFRKNKKGFIVNKTLDNKTLEAYNHD